MWNIKEERKEKRGGKAGKGEKSRKRKSGAGRSIYRARKMVEKENGHRS